MLKFNMFLYYIGALITAIGVLIGFPILFFASQNVGMYLVTMVTPLGFLLMFTGFIGYTLVRPNQNKADPRAQAEQYHSRVPD